MSVDATATPALPRFDIVFLDMDGVLADFQGAACKVHSKLPVADLIRLRHWEPQEWLMWKVFGVTQEKFWQLIDEAPNFWHDMPKTSFCDAVVNLARGLTDTVRVLSTPHDNDNSYAGKRHWCRFNLPGIKVTLNEDEPGQSSKALLAKPGRLLLDDSDKNVDAFRAAGGSAILIPQHWNSAHDKAPYGVLFYLAMELEKLRQEQVLAANPPGWNAAELQQSADRLLAHGGDQAIGTTDTSDAEIDAAQREGFRRIGRNSKPIEPDWPFAHPDFPTPPAGYGPGTNTGHGHAWQRPDGEYAKCRGVKHCPECSRDLRHFYGDDAEIVKANNPTMDEAIVEINTAIGKSIGEHIKSRLQADAELPATLLGYPVVQSAEPIEIKPGDIKLGPPLSGVMFASK